MAPARPSRLVLRENLHLVDYAILGLAFTSFLVFLLDRTALPADEVSALRVVDLALVALYGGAFGTKWVLADDPIAFLRRNALNALGVLPLTVNLFEPILPTRYYIVVQVVIVILRAGEALDRAFGARVLQGLFERYRSMVVEELTDPLLMRLAVVLEEAVVGRDYAAAIGKRVESRRDLMRAAVARGIAASPKLRRLYSLGPVQRKVDETTDELVDALATALTSPEVNQLIREGLQDAFAELKQNIADQKWRQKGVGVTDVAAGVVGAAGPGSAPAPPTRDPGAPPTGPATRPPERP